MKSKIRLLIIIIFAISFVFPSCKYFYSKYDKNDCMTNYIKFLDKNKTYNGYVYKIPVGFWFHVVNASDKIEIQELNENHWQQIWVLNWCTQKTNNPFLDINNTFYCSVVYLYNKI